jgi:uncharacterized protein YcbX
MPTLCRITIYPIKALDGCDVDVVRVLPSGALENDRRWAIVDGQGRFVNGKRTPAVHPVRAVYDDRMTTVSFSVGEQKNTFRLPEESAEFTRWLGEVLGLKCRLIENAGGGFPDDGNAPGPTVIGAASLAAVAGWFDGLDVAEIRRRIRANLEIDAAEPFWEDRLADDGSGRRRFLIGDVGYRGRTICKRCIVPTRDSRSGAGELGFARVFAERRARELPSWSPEEQFDHFYRLAINTAADWIPDGATLRVGNELTEK